jgi:hypothetical protein
MLEKSIKDVKKEIKLLKKEEKKKLKGFRK